MQRNNRSTSEQSRRDQRKGRKRQRTSERKVPAKAPEPLPLAQRMDWAKEVEEPLGDRPNELSTVARLLGAVISILKLMERLIEVGYPGDSPVVTPIGGHGDYLISKVTPEGWECLETLVDSGTLTPRNPEVSVSLEAPDSYQEYHDLSVILHLNGKYLPEDIAMGYPDGLPRPVRIFRVYKKSGERAHCVRLVFKNLDDRALILQRKKIKIWSNSYRVQPMNTRSKPPAGKRRRRQGRNE